LATSTVEDVSETYPFIVTTCYPLPYLHPL
jgi:hypothetical protein